MNSAWDNRLRLWDDFLRIRADFALVAQEHSIRLASLQRLTKCQPQVGEVVVSSLTRERGRIVRIMPQHRTHGGSETAFVVSVRYASAKNEQLWNESEIMRSNESRAA